MDRIYELFNELHLEYQVILVERMKKVVSTKQKQKFINHIPKSINLLIHNTLDKNYLTFSYKDRGYKLVLTFSDKNIKIGINMDGSLNKSFFKIIP